MIKFMAMKILRISDGGQVSVPAAVRRRWGTRRVVAEDLGDHLVIRPVTDDPIAQARGAFATYPGPDSDRMRRMAREEETSAD